MALGWGCPKNLSLETRLTEIIKCPHNVNPESRLPKKYLSCTMARQVKMPATKPDRLSSIPGIYTWKEISLLLQVVLLIDVHTLAFMCVCMPTHTLHSE